MDDFRLVDQILQIHGTKRTSLLAILHAIHDERRHVSPEILQLLADKMGMSAVDLRETLTFYHFFSETYQGKHTIWLNDSLTSRRAGFDGVLEALERELHIRPGQVSADGQFGLFLTPCIGLCDQEPAALINYIPFINLNPARIKEIIDSLKSGKTPAEVANELPDNQIQPNIHQAGPLFFQGRDIDGLRKAAQMEPEAILEEMKRAELRGRGGAGFTTGEKWQLCRLAPVPADNDNRYVVCNADEGEPGTFKDRVLLTESPRQILAGMAIASRAIGARQGYIYLRAEYRWLQDHLQQTIDHMLQENYLGQKICGQEGFDFEIQIVLGAGAYVCGEESALLESMEGKRGEPRIRPPFPVEKGYLGQPTTVNNVETFAAAAAIIDNGAASFSRLGTNRSHGTRLLSIAGDCSKPGIYEVPWGKKVSEILEMCEASDHRAVSVSGAAGILVNTQKDGHRQVCFEDLGTAGAFTVFNRDTDLMAVISNYTRFFIDETCGACVSCRNGTISLNDIFERIRRGHGHYIDLEKLRNWGPLISSASRCALGQTSSRPILSGLASFPEIFEKRLDQIYAFNLARATQDYYHDVLHDSPKESK